MLAMENAGLGWHMFACFYDSMDFPPISEIKHALVSKVAQACPWTVFQHLRKDMDGHFVQNVMDEMEKQIREAQL